MLQAIKEDIFRYQGNNYKNYAIRLAYFLKPYTRYMWYFRHAQYASNKFARIIWRILMRIAKYRSGVQIPPETKIGRGFRLLHFGNVVIHPQTVIGDNCNIAEGVLIGESFIRGEVGVPSIGNNCCIFANSIILGGVKISDNVLVAPGAFVDFNVPSNSIVIGNPGRIIAKESSPTEKYIVFPIKKMK